MGFVGQMLSNESGIQWYYIVGLLIFISLFITMVYRTIKMPKRDLNHYKMSILENDEQEDISLKK